MHARLFHSAFYSRLHNSINMSYTGSGNGFSRPWAKYTGSKIRIWGNTKSKAFTLLDLRNMNIKDVFIHICICRLHVTILVNHSPFFCCHTNHSSSQYHCILLTCNPRGDEHIEFSLAAKRLVQTGNCCCND